MLPYGISDFKQIQREGKFVIDKTMYISKMERTDNFIFLIKSKISNKPVPKEKDAVKPKRGRPPGSKNKKTLEKEAKIAKARENGIYEDPPVRKRGRPAGAKDSSPRKKRSDAGIKRGHRNKKM